MIIPLTMQNLLFRIPISRRNAPDGGLPFHWLESQGCREPRHPGKSLKWKLLSTKEPY